MYLVAGREGLPITRRGAIIMAKVTTAAQARIIATFRKDKGSVQSDLALIDDAREVGKDTMLAIVTEDRVAGIPKAVKGDERAKAQKAAEAAARNWVRQVTTAVALFDALVDKRAGVDQKREAASIILKRARRGSNDVKAKGCKIEGSGDDLVSAVRSKIEAKTNTKDEILEDMAKVSKRATGVEREEGPLLKASRLKVEAMHAALVEGPNGNAEKALKIARQIAEAIDYLECVRAEIEGRVTSANEAAAQAAATADMAEVEDAA